MNTTESPSIPQKSTKTNRINSTTKGGEEAPMKNIGSVETCFGGEMDHGCYGKERAREW